MRFLKDKDGWDYVEGVTFAAKHRKGRCICDACHRTGNATVILYPETKYWNGNGKDLEVAQKGMWLCNRCLRKLLKAIENAKEDW